MVDGRERAWWTAVSERDLDVVVLGATGVTGRRVAAYLAERAPATGLRWAAAARDPSKLARVLADEGAGGAPTLQADISEPRSLAQLAERTRVVLDLVGPYTLYGRPVIEACVAAGSHYADLTGEIPFVRSVIDDLDDRAQAAGVKVVQVAGFEALPPDLATAMAAESARERWGEELASVDVEVAVSGPPGLPRPSDGISGGTLQSLLAVAGEDNSEQIADPAALVPDAAQATAIRRTSPIGLAPRRGRHGGVVAPMAPAPFINPAVIHRTAVLSAAHDGREPVPFRYREGILIAGATATLPLRWGVAGALSATQIGLRRFAGAPVARRRQITGLLARITPESGFGPAADRLQAWRWRLQVHAATASGREVDVAVDAEGHPGYLATARMLGELGILLAEAGATPERAGCLTPAIALGTACAPRFASAGVRFSVSPA
jgi:short subunit dehydrogenase-like uncharacterized protein